LKKEHPGYLSVIRLLGGCFSCALVGCVWHFSDVVRMIGEETLPRVRWVTLRRSIYKAMRKPHKPLMGVAGRERAKVYRRAEYTADQRPLGGYESSNCGRSI